MGRKQEKDIVRHVTLEDLNKRIKKEEKSVRVLERLYFIRFIYKGDTIKKACEKVNISEPTGYSWLDYFKLNTPQLAAVGMVRKPT